VILVVLIRRRHILMKDIMYRGEDTKKIMGWGAPKNVKVKDR